MALTLPPKKDLETAIAKAIARLQTAPDDACAAVLVGTRGGGLVWSDEPDYWEIYTVFGDTCIYPNNLWATYWGSVSVSRESFTAEAIEYLTEDLNERISKNNPLHRPKD